MHWKVRHWWVPYVNGEVKNVPNCLTTRDISACLVPLSFVIFIFHTKHGLIRAFVNILGDVFNRLDRIADSHVDVGIEHLEEDLIVRNHPPVVDLYFLAFNRQGCKSTTIITCSPVVQRITVPVRLGFPDQISGVTLCALAILHAQRARVQCTTRPVNHVLRDQIVQHWIFFGAGYFCMHNLIDISWRYCLC